ncbi:MAG: thrombospondin type 3 repeat-containing protein [Patescibacteria group bacterium]|jgi:hypothetical protein|nr:thrombospondin type 3 repeat-containing protein [Patescibacteria group bacterium]
MGNNLQGYINTQLKRGISKERIKESLKAQGWQEKDIEESFNLNESQKTSSKKIPKKLITIILFVVLGLVVIGGAVFSYFKYFQTPEKVLAKMMEKITEIETIQYSSEIDFELTIDESVDLSMFSDSEAEEKNSDTKNTTINFAGSLDFRDEDNKKSDFKLDIKSSMIPDSIGLETRFIEKTIYFSLTSLPSIDFLDFSLLENQWVKVDIKEIEDQVGQEVTEKKESFDLTSEQKEKIKKKLEESSSFEITEKLDSETINNINTYHYKYKINNENLVILIEEISKIINEDELDDNELPEIKNTLENYEDFEGEIWIGKKDYFLHKITLKIQAKEETEKNKEKNKEETETDNNIDNIDIAIQLKNHNQDIEITAPESSKSIEQFIEEAFSLMLPPTQDLGFTDTTKEGSEFTEELIDQNNDDVKEKNDEGDELIKEELSVTEIEELKNKDSDNDGLSDYEEMFTYNTLPLVSDTDEDGYPDGEEVENGYNPLGSGKLN